MGSPPLAPPRGSKVHSGSHGSLHVSGGDVAGGTGKRRRHLQHVVPAKRTRVFTGDGDTDDDSDGEGVSAQPSAARTTKAMEAAWKNRE